MDLQRVGTSLALTLLVAACGRLGFEPQRDPTGDATSGDAALDGAVSCQTWGPPSVMASLNTVVQDWSPSLSPDGSLLVFGSKRDGPDTALYMSTLSSGSWTPPVRLSILDALLGTKDGSAWSPSGLALYFDNDSTGNSQIWVSAYNPATGAFAPPTLAPGLETTLAGAPFVRSDDLELMLTDDMEGDVLHSTRLSPADAWGPVTAITELNTATLVESFPTLTPNGRTIYIEKDSGGSRDFWRASRPALDQPFGPLSPVDELNSAGSDGDPDISRDGRTLFMSSDRPSGATQNDLYVSTCLQSE